MDGKENGDLSEGKIDGVSVNRERSPSGILRLDSGRPRRFSNEVRIYQYEPSSPQPSIDRLSVTFAEDPGKGKTTKVFFPLVSEILVPMDKPTTSKLVQGESDVKQNNESDQEDYSASVNAIIQRRASTRRSKRKNRRSSSPFPSENPVTTDELRRRSSVFTTSSGETAITIEENLNNEATQDEICEMIKLHKEVLSNVKFQPCSMRKKLKLIRQARAYIKKHEGELQVRLAQSHSTKDMVARWKIYLAKKWQKWKSEIINYSLWLIPWELKIKEIESHFGSVVASYFIFLRWLFWVNIVIAVVLISFVTIPEIIMVNPNTVKERKFILEEEKYNATNFLTLWDFEGAFKYSPLFYGWYTSTGNMESDIIGGGKEKGNGYRLPLAYFITGVLVYAYSFFAILRKMAENSRASRMSEKDDECNFSVKLFTAWDFTIGNAETAHNRIASIVMGFKEALLEEVEKKREPKNWKIICLRILVNLLVIGMLSCSAWVVIFVVKRSNEPEAQLTPWRRNESTLVITLITNIFPFLFEILGFLEQYHPRKTLQVQLARIMVLNLLNLYSLVFSTLSKISEMSFIYHEINNHNQSTTSLAPNILEDRNITCFCSKTILLDGDVRLLESENLLADREFEKSLTTENFITEDYTETLTQNISKIIKILTEPVSETISENLTSFTETDNNIIESYNTTVDTTENITDFTTEYETLWANYTTFYYNNSTEISHEDFTDFDTNETSFFNNEFVDFLAYILGPFNVFWKSNFSENYTLVNDNSSLDFNKNETFTEEYLSFNDSITLILSNNSKITDLSTQDYSLSTEYITSQSTYDERFITLTDIDITTNFDLSTIAEERLIFDKSNTTFFNTSQSTKVSTATALSTYITTRNPSECKCGKQENISSTEIPALVVNSTLSSSVKKQLEEYWKLSKYEQKAKERTLCWETMFGQELIKLTVMDLVGTIGISIGIDFFRGILVRFMNNCWCWDLEKKFPQYGDFKVAENILHLVNNQGMVWMGMFFSPGLVALNVIKLYLMMYFRAWVVLTCNVPPTVTFRASRSNNFYYALLLMMLFLCVLPVSYAIVWVEPSYHCGPFSRLRRIFHIFTITLYNQIPKQFHWVLEYIASPGIVIPLLLLLVLIIYYLMSLTSALKGSNDDLKTQLKQERTEGRRKMFKEAEKRRRAAIMGESNDLSEKNPFSKWKKLLGDLPSGKSHDDTIHDTPKQQSEEANGNEKKVSENRSKVFFSRLIKKALGKSSTSDEDNTDNEQHDSLPYDINRSTLHTPVNRSVSNNSFDLQNFVNRAWNLRKTEKTEEATKENLNLKEKEDDHNKKEPLDAKWTEKITELTKPDNKDIKIAIESDKANSLDSDASSLWSESIPVIKISKTESDESFLSSNDDKPDKNNKYEREFAIKTNEANSSMGKIRMIKTESDLEKPEGSKNNSIIRSVKTCGEFRSFKPKIKCVLKKQSTEIDEDIILHFGEDIEKTRNENELVKIYAEEKINRDINSTSKQDLTRDEILLSEQSSSEGTEEKAETSSSMQTVFHVSSDSDNDSSKNN